MSLFRVIRGIIFISIFAAVSTLLWSLSSRIYIVSLVIVISVLAGNFVIYCKIYLIARRHQRQIQHQHQQQRQASNENNARVTRLKKTAFNTFIVYILLICCYMPFSFATLYGGMSLKVYFTTITPMFLNSSLNPLLYCWRDREIRIAVKQLFCRWNIFFRFGLSCWQTAFCFVYFLPWQWFNVGESFFYFLSKSSICLSPFFFFELLK